MIAGGVHVSTVANAVITQYCGVSSTESVIGSRFLLYLRQGVFCTTVGTVLIVSSLRFVQTSSHTVFNPELLKDIANCSGCESNAGYVDYGPLIVVKRQANVWFSANCFKSCIS